MGHQGSSTKKCQQEAFNEEIVALKSGKVLKSSSKILALNPQLDDMGMLRCNGRLQYSDYLPFEVKFPIILPKIPILQA